MKNHSFKQFIYFSAPLRIFSKFFFKDSLLDVRNVTFEPGIYWLGTGHRHKFLVGESAPATAKKKPFLIRGLAALIYWTSNQISLYIGRG